MKRHSIITLSADISAAPTEFLLFRRGINATTKGEFLFDDEAAASVMAAYKRQGVDLMIDLEHESLGSPVRSDSADARGWFKLELRDGDLYAVDVRWAPDGRRRLANKTQRYTSPAFLSGEDGRIREIINCALVAMPATHGNAALVAARKGACAPAKTRHTVGRTPQRVTRLNRMDPTQIKAALDAIEAGDQGKALEILKALIASAAGAEASEVSADPGAEAMSDDPAADPPKDGELAALRKQIATLTKAQSAELVELRATVKALTDERDAKDQTERVALCGELVKLGAEIPATVWADADKQVPAKRLQSEPIAELRARVEVLRKARPEGKPLAPPPSESEGKQEIKLSKAEQDYCKRHNLTPEQFAAKRAASARTAPSTK